MHVIAIENSHNVFYYRWDLCGRSTTIEDNQNIANQNKMDKAKLNDIEKLEKLDKWLKCFKSIEAAYGDLRKSLGAAPESPVVTALYAGFQGYTESLAELIGDKGGWLDWFIWENGAGSKKMSAQIGTKMRPICSTSDLVKLLQ